jgi:hypothetical protein
MWDPQRLTSLWRSTACDRDSFTFPTYYVIDFLAISFPLAFPPISYMHYISLNNISVALVRKRTIPIERPPHVGEVSANICG